MNKNSILIRDGDGKEFKVIGLGHWSYIVSLDGTEEFHVKCYGPDMYVGVKGPTFKLRKD